MNNPHISTKNQAYTGNRRNRPEQPRTKKDEHKKLTSPHMEANHSKRTNNGCGIFIQVYSIPTP